MTDVGTVRGTIELEDKFSNPLNLFQSALQGFAAGGGIAAFTSALNLVTSSVGKIIDVMPKAVAAYQENEDAVFRLSAAMQSQGQNTSANRQSYLDQAEALMKMGTAGDEAIMGIQKRFIMLGQEKDQVMKTTEAVLNLAHATGQDAGSVTQAFVSAARGRTMALRQFGVIIDEHIPKSQKLQNAIDQVSKRFAGLGGITTWSDRVKNLTNAQDEMWEGMGKGIVTSGKLTTGFDELRGLAWKLVDAINKNQDTIRSWVNSGIMLAADALVYLSKTVLVAYDTLSTFKMGINQTQKSFWGLVQASNIAIDAILVGFNSLVAAGSKVVIVAGAMNDAMRNPTDAVGIYNRMSEAIKILGKDEAEYTAKIVEGANTRSFEYGKEMARLAQNASDEMATYADRMKSLKEFVKIFEDLRLRLAKAPDVTNPVAGKVGTKVDMPDQNSRAIEAFQKKLDDFYTSIKTQTAGIRGAMAGGLTGGLEPINAAFDATMRNMKEFEKEAKADGKAWTEEDITKYTKAAESVWELSKAQMELALRQQTLGQTFGDVEKEVSNFFEQIDNLKGGIESLTSDALQQNIDKLKNWKKEFKGDDEACKELDEQIKVLQDTLDQRPGQFLEKMASTLEGVAAVTGAVSSGLNDVGLGASKGAQVLEGFGQYIEGNTEFAKGLISGNPVQMITGGIKSLTGAFKGLKAAFGDAEWEKVNDLRDAAQASVGTWDEFQVAVAKTGLSLDAFLDAKKEEDFTKAWEEVQDALAATDLRETFVKAAGGIDKANAAANTLRVSLKGLFDAKTQKDAQDYIDKYNELTELTKQLADIGAEGAGRLAESFAASVDFSKISESGLHTGLQILTPADAAAQAQIALLSFAQMAKQVGPIAAGDAFAPILEALKANMVGLGVDVSALLGPLMSGVALSANEQFRGASQSASGLADVLSTFRAQELPLTTDQLGAFGQQAQSAFDQAVAGGGTMKESYAAIMPLLGQMQGMANQYGMSLDDNTKRLIAEANAMGLAFPTDPIDRLVEAIGNLIVQLGGELPKTMQSASASIVQGMNDAQQAAQLLIDTAGMTPEDWTPGGKDYYSTQDPAYMATGGIVSRATNIIAGEAGREAIIPLSEMSNVMGSVSSPEVSDRLDKLIALTEMALAQGRDVYLDGEPIYRGIARGVPDNRGGIREAIRNEVRTLVGA
jgi:hypothetical protein